MTATNMNTHAGGPNTEDVWSVGDYDGLASYGSAPEAARLVRFAGVTAGEQVLDVGTGSGIVAIVAAQRGARVTGVDPTPALLSKATGNAALASCGDIEWQAGAAENLSFSDASFDVVLSQYAHMFSPQPDTAASEMLRVLKPGGRIAFAAWTPDGVAPRLMGLTFRYLPPRPGVAPPSPFEWADAQGVARYLNGRVRDIVFEPGALQLPALSTAHARRLFEESFGPTVLLVRALSNEPTRLAQWRREHDTAAADFFADGRMRFDYLLTRAIKM
jgi:SAM-dependent methyltransferase